MEVTLECKTRPEGSKPRALRREGFIPANLYGHSGAEALSLVLTHKEAITLLKNASVNNTLVDLAIPELDWNGKVLIREVQTHPWKRNLHHISFFCPSGDNDVEVVVPLKIVGNSIGISQGGIMEQMVTQVKVRCLPTNIPEYLEMDISGVDIGKTFSVANLVLPEGIKVLDDPNKNIMGIVAPRKKG
ncbi:50S ribosomal protein L25/general stress protein Ctc [Geminocystis sp. NIES-3709]|uniref:50S ribosomal protein L25/general stress protein Ctc n=1 Tax=Geminocystis sp. NIES-3709 TaxID=1617448 RepID=UPI0005FCC2AA|nr:50S ribosomal protein L25/general stress protein Ctc [Geminocystis sp. NIES-3709]BAQ65337.1 LSU ribosomal protein L25p [Geminocystis sp. NIES-3709]